MLQGKVHRLLFDLLGAGILTREVTTLSRVLNYLSRGSRLLAIMVKGFECT